MKNYFDVYDPCDREASRRSLFVDINGNPIKRTPFTDPYSYEEYVIWKGEYDTQNSDAVCSDRLLQWDYEKYQRCCNAIFGNTGQMFNDREPKQIEQFLSLYFEQKIKLTAIMQGCNHASGFPYWVFFYENIK